MDSRRPSGRLASFALVTLALIALPSLAADDAWTQTGAPTGGSVYKVAVDPTDSSHVYALSDPGVYESHDGGASWTQVLSDPGHILDMAMAPSDPATLYATTYNKLVYKTSDGGANWTTVTDPVTTSGQTEIVHVTVDPTDADTVYVLTDNSGIFKSTDGGSSWNPANSGLTTLIAAVSGWVNNVIFNRLVVDPADNQVLYLAVSTDVNNTHVGGLYTSTDGGAHWSVTALSNKPIKDIDLDPTDHTHLVAAGCGLAGDGFYSVTGSGATLASTSSFGVCPERVRIDPSDAQHIYGGSSAGLSESTDGGATWNDVADITEQGMNDIAVDPQAPANVFVSTSYWGLYRSADSGASWALSNDGIPPINGDINVDSMAQDITAPGTLYAGTDDGLYQTLDGGAHWTILNNGISNNDFFYGLAVDPQVPATVYAGGLYGFYKSTDSGASWNPAGTGLPSTPAIVSIAVDPTDSNVVFVGSSSYGLYTSTDGGASFTPATGDVTASTWIAAIAFDPADHETVYVSTINDISFYKSTDGGASWTKSDSGFPSVLLFTGFSQIVIDPVSPDTIFLLPYQPGFTNEPAYVSTDAGATWAPLTTASALQGQAMRARTAHAPESGSSSAAVELKWLTFNPKKTSQLTAMGADHKLYTLSSIASTGSGSSGGGSSGGSGGSGGGSGGGNAASSGGGGGFPLLAGLVLIGLGLPRRRR